MEYLFKASIVIAIFYVTYKLFLQKETFFEANRWYLLMGLFTALFIPLIVIPIYIEQTQVIDHNIAITNFITDQQVISNEDTFDYWKFGLIIYGLGLLFFTGKILIEFASLKFLFNKHNHYSDGFFNYIETEDEIAPFSFFNWIVFNPENYTRDELHHILNHEKAHAKAYHSIDMILIQMACITFWFNPLVWLYKKELEQNLEFIADRKAQDYANCNKSYQRILLKSSITKYKFLLANNFYNSQIKKRIIMLHKSKSNKLNAWKYAFTLPFLALFLMSFNTKEILVEKELPEEINALPQIEAANQLNAFYNSIENNDQKISETSQSQQNDQVVKVIPVNKEQTAPIVKNSQTLKDISVTVIDKSTTDSELNSIKKRLEKEGLEVKFKGVKRNSKGEITAIKIEAKSDSSSTRYQVSSDDEAIEPIQIMYDNDTNNISIGSNHTKHDEDTFVYETKDGGSYKIHKSGKGSNVVVITEEEREDKDEDEEEDTKIIVRGYANKGKVKMVKRSKNVEVISGDDEKVEIIIEEDNDSDNEVIIVNGKRVHLEDDEDTIVVKGTSKNVWVTKSDDKNDDMLIELDVDSDKMEIKGEGDKQPLYIVDGKEVSKEDIADLKPENIESVTVLKDKSAIKKYGKKAKDGVIIIKTKD